MNLVKQETSLTRERHEELAITIYVGEEFVTVSHEYPDIAINLTLFNATIKADTLQKLKLTVPGDDRYCLLRRTRIDSAWWCICFNAI